MDKQIKEAGKAGAVKEIADIDKDILALFKAGAHFGHPKSKQHPKMAPFIFSLKNKIQIIDLEKTKEKLDEAFKFLKSVKKSGGQILFVGTKKQAKDIVKKLAKECDMPYVSSRWIGGTFTNNKVISKRIKKLDEIEAIMGSEEEMKKYTKQEIAKFKKEAERINEKLEGLRNLKGFPKTIFIFDIIKDKTAVDEAKKMNIPIAALVDTNTNPAKIDYPIPCNDDAIAVIKLIADFIKKAIK